MSEKNSDRNCPTISPIETICGFSTEIIHYLECLPTKEISLKKNNMKKSL